MTEDDTCRLGLCAAFEAHRNLAEPGSLENVFEELPRYHLSDSLRLCAFAFDLCSRRSGDTNLINRDTLGAG